MRDYGADENGWKDGLVAHRCGFYIEEHRLVNGKSVCPPTNDEIEAAAHDLDMSRRDAKHILLRGYRKAST